MIDQDVSRRQLIRGGMAGLAAGILRPRWGWAAADGNPIALAAITRTIEVKGKPAKIYGLLNAAGGQGLAFNVGDRFRVRLTNKLSEPTVVHWHGLTPPSNQDGVPELSQVPVPAGGSYDYDFPLTRSGTYFMHSHMSLEQTQRRLSAPLIIHAKEEQSADEQEVVVMLGDFTFRDPDEILAELQGRGKGGAGTKMGGMAMPKGDGAMNMGGMNMPGMDKATAKAPATPGAPPPGGMAMQDVNDIDFDAYLANDRTLDDPEIIRVERGAMIRLRIINSADSTNFFIDLGAVDGDLIAVDGHPIAPIRGRNFPIAMAQRLDIRLRLPTGGSAFPILAQREGDTIRTGIVLATKEAAVARIPEQATAKAGVLDLALERRLRPIDPPKPKTADRSQPVTLGGDMSAYVWTMDGAVYGKNKPIMIKKGERVELVMNNTTQMAHPMHLHGTVFQVVAIGGKRFDGARRDTVLVEPRSSVTIAFDADNPGRWAFHCHNLYHQEAGMMTSVDYA